MQSDEILKLTMAVYRVTDRFPEKEPLRHSIREIAGRVLRFVAAPHACDGAYIRNDRELLDRYFAIAKTQGWVAVENFEVLEKEYEKLFNGFLSARSLERKAPVPSRFAGATGHAEKKRSGNGNGYSVFVSPQDRQRKVMEAIVQRKEGIMLRDLLQSFPINKRTLIRDLENLLRLEAIKKEGNGRGVVYIPNGQRGEIVASDIN